MAQFTDIQGFPIDARQYLKENTPAIKFPQFQASIPQEGIYAGQYADFDFGNRPSDTPANTGIDIMPSQVIKPVKDGFGLRVQKYYKKKTAFIQTMKILRQVINEQKKNYSAGLAIDRRRRMEERVRSLMGDIRGMTPEMAQSYIELEGRPNNRAIEGNDVNSLVRQFHGDLLGSDLSTTLDEKDAPSGGTAGASQVAIREMGMPDKFAQLEGLPTGEEDLPAPIKGEREERLMDSVEALRDLAQRGGISDDLRESFALSAESGDDLLGLGQGESGLAGRFATYVEDMAGDDDLLAYEPGMVEDETLSLVPSTFEEDLQRLTEDGSQIETTLTQQTGRPGLSPEAQMEVDRTGRPFREAKGRARRMIKEQVLQGAVGRVRARGRNRRRRMARSQQELQPQSLEARIQMLNE